MELALIGDLHVQRDDPAAALAGLAPLLAGADLRFANLEGPLCGPDGPGIPHKPNWTHPDRRMVAALTAAHIDVVSCANNVTFPASALLDSLAVLDGAGIAHCGGGIDHAAAHRPALLSAAGTTVAFLAYTSICWPFGHAATRDAAGVAAVRATTTYQPDFRVAEVPGRAPKVITTPIGAELAVLCRDVEAARERADAVVVSCHWGIPGDELCDYQTTIGHTAIDAGAALVVGHGPHTVQGVERRGDGAILYSLGNSVFDWEPMRGRHLDGLVARCRFDGGRLVGLDLLPTVRDAANDVRPAARDALPFDI